LKKRVPSKWSLGSKTLKMLIADFRLLIDLALFNQQSAIENQSLQFTRETPAGERSAFPTTWCARRSKQSRERGERLALGPGRIEEAGAVKMVGWKQDTANADC
jgi:hypothetical protein